MAKKTYRTFYLTRLQLLLKKDGKRIEINFRGGSQIDSTCRYTTADPAEQELIEKSSGFNRDYYVESVRETAEEKKAAPVEEKPAEPAAPKEEKPVMENMKGTERFRNLVEMKNRMKELGIELDDDANYAKAKAAASKAGYDFQIQR